MKERLRDLRNVSWLGKCPVIVARQRARCALLRTMISRCIVRLDDVQFVDYSINHDENGLSAGAVNHGLFSRGERGERSNCAKTLAAKWKFHGKFDASAFDVAETEIKESRLDPNPISRNEYPTPDGKSRILRCFSGRWQWIDTKIISEKFKKTEFRMLESFLPVWNDRGTRRLK